MHFKEQVLTILEQSCVTCTCEHIVVAKKKKKKEEDQWTKRKKSLPSSKFQIPKA